MLPTRRALSVTAVLVLGMAGCLRASDELEREVTRHDAEVAKAQQTFDDAVTAANDKAIKAYVRIAQRLTKANDIAGASAAWKEVMRLQRANAEARSFFTTMNTLDDVLKELDAPPTDLLGNPIAAPGRPAVVFGADGALVPSPATVLTEGFTTRTTELIVARVAGDGVIFEEGAQGNGQAIGIIGDEIHYVVRAGSRPFIIKAPFDRKAAWTHIAVQFDAGEVRLWLNGKLAAKGASPFAAIPAHGDGGLGKGSGGNSGDWATSCRYALAAFRLSGTARFTDQAGPDGRMEVDKATLLSVTPEEITAQLPPPSRDAGKTVAPTAVKRIASAPPGGVVWTPSGEVDVAR